MSGAPGNPAGEMALLGEMMNHNHLIDQVREIVGPEDLIEPLHGRILATLYREREAGRPANPVTLRPYFSDDPAMVELGGPIMLMRLTEQPLFGGAIDVAKQLADLALRRRMQEGLTAAAASCGDLEATIAEIVSFADGAISNPGKEQIHQPTGAECLDELINGFDEGDYGITCGCIPSLDELLGRMRPGQLNILAARPGMGKTAVAVSYGLGAAQRGHGVLFISLEMSSRDLGGRMAADLCFDRFKIGYSAIRDGKLDGWQRRKIIEAGSYMRGLPFQVVDIGTLTLGRLNMLVRRHARRMAAAGNKLELIVIDYLQLLKSDRKGSRYEDVTEASMALKALAKDQGVAVLALSQLSRTVETRPDKRPMLSDLRESGQIEQDADAVLFLLRDEYYLHQAEPDAMHADRAKWEQAIEVAKGKLEIILAKRRNGTIGSRLAAFHGQYQAVRG